MKKLLGALLLSASLLMAMTTYEMKDNFIAGEEDSPALWGTTITEMFLA